jgi:hypothetical protein
MPTSDYDIRLTCRRQNTGESAVYRVTDILNCEFKQNYQTLEEKKYLYENTKNNFCSTDFIINCIVMP